jgi:hypothetical protein
MKKYPEFLGFYCTEYMYNAVEKYRRHNALSTKSKALRSMLQRAIIEFDLEMMRRNVN